MTVTTAMSTQKNTTAAAKSAWDSAWIVPMGSTMLTAPATSWAAMPSLMNPVTSFSPAGAPWQDSAGLGAEHRNVAEGRGALVVRHGEVLVGAPLEGRKRGAFEIVRNIRAAARVLAHVADRIVRSVGETDRYGLAGHRAVHVLEVEDAMGVVDALLNRIDVVPGGVHLGTQRARLGKSPPLVFRRLGLGGLRAK